MHSVILLHGALGSSEDMQALATELKANGLEPYSFSFSGHGTSPFSENFGIKQFAGELHTFIETHRLQQPAVFGYSMGGYVALYHALMHPGVLGAIATLGTKFNWTEEVVKKETALLHPATLREKAPGFALKLQTKHGNKWEALLGKTATMIRELSDKNLLRSETMRTIENNVLIGLADKDNMVTLDETNRTYKSLHNAQMYLLPGAKHPIETVNTRLLGRIVAEFYASA
jgi:esterase/lipase